MTAHTHSLAKSASEAKSERRSTNAISSKRILRARLASLLIAIDCACISLGFLITAIFWVGDEFLSQYINIIPIFLPVYLLAAVQEKAYSIRLILASKHGQLRSFKALIIAAGIVLGVAFYFKISAEISRAVLAMGIIQSAVFLIGARHAFNIFGLRILDGTLESELLLLDETEVTHAGKAQILDVASLGLTPRLDDPVMLDAIGRQVQDVDRLIVACPSSRRTAWAMALRGAGLNVEVMAPELDTLGALGVQKFHGVSTVLVAAGPLGPSDRLVKRVFDLILVALTAPLTAPLVLAIALAVKLDSPGPILFKQKRVGQGNRLFWMYKFRSMRAERSDPNATVLATREDDRITRVGRFIRRTSLDELPQLINVLRGDMSIVGPRPHAIGAIAGDELYWEVNQDYWQRHAAMPGLTGLAQVKGYRGNTETRADLENRLSADLEYLRDWTIWRDFYIFLKTFKVLLHKNAY